MKFKVGDRVTKKPVYGRVIHLNETLDLVEVCWEGDDGWTGNEFAEDLIPAPKEEDAKK